ncbi:MAG: putative toxin-antitoxin system toxin component, PIN family [Chlamydiota bacterium]
MRVFLDTNVLASALATRGLCADILRKVINSDDLIISEPLVIELRRIMARKFHVTESLINEMVAFLQQDTIPAPDGNLIDIEIRDKDDVIILSSAIRAKNQVFVTGDKEVLALGKIGRMRILSPRGFWDTTKKKA